jgi:hypothetical protein
MAHPSLGAPPRDLTAGHPAAANRLRAGRTAIRNRVLEIAIERDPTLRDRYDEVGLRKLLRDADGLLERLALAVASGDPVFMSEYAEWVAPVYRRRRVPMDDLVNLLEGLRRAAATALSPDERVAADNAIDAGIRVFRWHRRIAGDARKRNPIAAFLYKGA